MVTFAHIINISFVSHLILTNLFGQSLTDVKNKQLSRINNITVKVTFVYKTFVLVTSISAISQLLLSKFWSNFKGKFLGTFKLDSNCHDEICPGNICPRNICPYQEYLSSNWPDIDETLKIGFWEHLEQIPTVMMTFVQATFVLTTFIHIRNISVVTDPMLTKL